MASLSVMKYFTETELLIVGVGVLSRRNKSEDNEQQKFPHVLYADNGR
jgi:hypothetical protein